jgi:hypothetical protein
MGKSKGFPMVSLGTHLQMMAFPIRVGLLEVFFSFSHHPILGLGWNVPKFETDPYK